MGKINTVLRNRNRSFGIIFVAFLILGSFAFVGAQFGHKQIIAADTPNGPTKSVIVQFKNTSAVTATSSKDAQRSAIESADQKVFEGTPYTEGYKQKQRQYENLPIAVYEVDQDGEASLRSDPNVASVSENSLFEPSLYRAVVSIGGSTTTGFSDGVTDYTGNGYTVAILDSGVESTHSMLSGKVISEACFNSNGTSPGIVAESRCPGGGTSASGAGAGADCDPAIVGCGHGTGVASIAAGKPTVINVAGGGTETISGSALGADIIAINVFTKITSVSVCGDTDPCIRSYSSDQLAALDYLIGLEANNSLTQPLAAVNMSIGSSANSTSSQSFCDSYSSLAPINAAAGTLKGYKVATVISTGNDGAVSGQQDKVGMPGCASNAVAVGATNLAGTTIASYSNNGPLTDLLAPGGDGSDETTLMVFAGVSNGLKVAAGTSMAAPMVTGAFATLREKHPNASVNSLLSLLQTSGVDVTDGRSGYTVGAKKSIRLAAALTQSPYATISDFAGPVGTVNEGEAVTLTATVANATSCSLNHGVGNVTISGGTTISKSVPGAASYILSCLNTYGDTVTDTLTFTINPAPTVPVISQQTYDKAAGTFTLAWADSTDADGVEEYRVFLNGQLVVSLPSTITSYAFSGILANTAYTAEVRAVDTLGAISSAASASFGEAIAPSTPNTGALSLLYNGQGRAILVAALGIVVVLGVIAAVRRKA